LIPDEMRSRLYAITMVCPGIVSSSKLHPMKRIVLLTTALLFSLLPAFAQDWAKQSLEKSPRHQEWVDIKHDNRVVHAFVVYPETKGKAPAVVVIHEIFGMTDWVRSVADQLAAAGYIAIAPDLLSGFGPNGGKSSDFSGVDAAREAVSKLDADTVTADLSATADYVKKLPSANGKLAVAGFCWGGGQSFRFATNRHDLAAAFVFYGPPPDAMKQAGKKYDPVTYEGAGHGFMRSGEDPAGTEANKKAREQAWQKWLGVLKTM
jgi:carboxymethylenebutenolidase